MLSSLSVRSFSEEKVPFLSFLLSPPALNACSVSENGKVSNVEKNTKAGEMCQKENSIGEAKIPPLPPMQRP